MKVFIFILTLLIIFLPLFGNAEINSSALWRSAVLAGWGQLYSGDSTKGYIFMGSEILLLGGSVATYLIQDKAYDDYSTAKSDFDNKWDSYESKLLLCQITIGITVAFYLYNLIDAAFFTKNKSISLNNNPIKMKMYVMNGWKYDVSYNKKF